MEREMGFEPTALSLAIRRPDALACKWMQFSEEVNA